MFALIKFLKKREYMKIAIVNSNFLSNSEELSREKRLKFNFGNRLCSSGLQNIVNENLELINEISQVQIEKFDLFILNLQDHLRPEVAGFLDDNIYLLPPNKTLVTSVGINAFNGKIEKKKNDKLIDFLKKCSVYSKIGCRGEHTKMYLNLRGIENTIITGCPSIFNNFQENYNLSNKLLTAGGVGLSQSLKKDLINPNQIFLSYILQGDYDLNISNNLNLDGAVQKKLNNGFILYTKNKTFFSNLSIIKLETKMIVNNFIRPFENTIDLSNYISEFAGFVGSRVHSSILSLLNGVPAINLNFDLRAIEICGTLNIPNGYMLNVNSKKEYLDFFEENRNILINQFLKKRQQLFEIFFKSYSKYLKLKDLN